MSSLFGLTGNELIFYQAHLIAAGQEHLLKWSQEQALQRLQKICARLALVELSPGDLCAATYTACQNTLLSQQWLPDAILVTLPSFNDDARLNLEFLLDAWHDGGADSLREQYWQIFEERFYAPTMYQPDETNWGLLRLRRAAFARYGTVETANRVIDHFGYAGLRHRSVGEFLELIEIRESRRGLSSHELNCLVTCTIACGSWDTVGLDRAEALKALESFCPWALQERTPPEQASGVFRDAQMGLMGFRRNYFEIIQFEPPFQEYGLNNLSKLFLAWAFNGKTALEYEFEQIFEAPDDGKHAKQAPIKILSGSGETIDSPIKFSTSEMNQRIRAEFWYVNYLFGYQEEYWEEEMHMTTFHPVNFKTISLWKIRLRDGSKRSIYFDTNSDE